MPNAINWKIILHDNYQDVADMILGHSRKENMSIPAMAEHFGVCETTLKTKIRKLGLSLRKTVNRL